jgi:hypothetical protein
MRETVDWEAYYQTVSGRQARPLLENALEHAGISNPELPRQAIDLGWKHALRASKTSATSQTPI